MEDQHIAVDAPNDAVERGREGWTLHVLVPPLDVWDGDMLQADWDAIKSRCWSHPEEAARPYNREDYGHVDEKERVLHAVMCYNPPIDVVCAVIQAYPDALDMQTCEFETPLALACRHGASPQILRMLVHGQLAERQKKNVELVREFDHSTGRGDNVHPLHPLSFILHEEAISAETVKILLAEFPPGAFNPEVKWDCVEDGNYLEEFFFLFYDQACHERWTDDGRKNEWEKLQLLLTVAEYGTIEPTFLRGRPRCCIQTLLKHISKPACRNQPGLPHIAPENLANIIAETKLHDPGQFSSRDASGQLPLHALLSLEWTGKPGSPEVQRVVRAMLGAYPEAARIPYPCSGALPLHVALYNFWPYEDLLAAEPRALLTRCMARPYLYPCQYAWSKLSSCIDSEQPHDDFLYALNAAYTLIRADPMMLIGAIGADRTLP